MKTIVKSTQAQKKKVCVFCNNMLSELEQNLTNAFYNCCSNHKIDGENLQRDFFTKYPNFSEWSKITKEERIKFKL